MALPDSPLTRGEQYLAKAAGQDTALPNVPLTRTEQYLAKIAGQDVSIPDVPLTRIEQYLAYIAENGSGGGGATSMTDVTFNGTLAQPLSASNCTTLMQQIGANKACAEINFDFQGTAVFAYLRYVPSNSILVTNGADIGSNLNESLAFMLIWDSTGAASRARVIMSGSVVDLLSMVSQIACTVTVHTLDASAYQ